MVLLFLFFAALFLADALGNWGMFRKTYKHQTSAEKYRRYGPVERVFRIGLGAGFVGVMLLISAVFWSRGGSRALMHPGDYTGADWAPPPAYRPTLAPPAPSPPPERPGPAPREAPAPPKDPPPTSRPPDAELQLWLYEDTKGVTHMVDRLEKVPEAFRAKARPMK